MEFHICAVWNSQFLFSVSKFPKLETLATKSFHIYPILKNLNFVCFLVFDMIRLTDSSRLILFVYSDLFSDL